MVRTFERPIRWSHKRDRDKASCPAVEHTAFLANVLIYMGVLSVSRSAASFGVEGVRQRALVSPFLARRLQRTPSSGAVGKHIRLLYLLAGFPAGSISQGPHQQVCPVIAQAATMEAATANPLLEETYLPAFDKVKAEHVVPGMTALLEELNSELDNLEKSVEPTWSGLVDPIERITDKLSRAWGTISHLKAVKDSPALREAVETVQPERVKFSLRMSQSKPLYEAFKALKEGPEWGNLTEAQQRLVNSELRDFVLGGVALEGDAKERFNENQQELSQLSTKFTNNVMDAIKSYKKVVKKAIKKEKQEVDGLPPTALELASQSARSEGFNDSTPENGPWVFTLDIPSYQPALMHLKNRALREELYRMYSTRASSGAGDNTPIIERTLELRRQQAALLGFPQLCRHVHGQQDGNP
eukprot:jgi/Botrbrau1/18720/Bobra.0386s0043.1